MTKYSELYILLDVSFKFAEVLKMNVFRLNIFFYARFKSGLQFYGEKKSKDTLWPLHKPYRVI